MIEAGHVPVLDGDRSHGVTCVSNVYVYIHYFHHTEVKLILYPPQQYMA